MNKSKGAKQDFPLDLQRLSKDWQRCVARVTMQREHRRDIFDQLLDDAIPSCFVFEIERKTSVSRHAS